MSAIIARLLAGTAATRTTAREIIGARIGRDLSGDLPPDLQDAVDRLQAVLDEGRTKG